MRKKPTKYGVIDIPAGSVICTLENGGDKDGKAMYRFSDSGKRTANRLIALVTGETIMQDLYGDMWAHTPKGWVKAEKYTTWYESYKEASDKMAALTHRHKRVLKYLLAAAITGLTGYLIYKYLKNKTTNITPPVETPATDEIPLV